MTETGGGTAQAPEESPLDLGVQNERTTLAWRRTNLSALATTALLARVSGHTEVALAVLAAALGVTAAVGRRADVRSRSRATALAVMDGPPWPDLATPRGILGATALTLSLSVLGLTVIALT